MFKKYVSKCVIYIAQPFKKIIRNIILDVINEERTKPLYDKLKLSEYTKTSKLTIYDAIVNMPLHEISLNVEYIDPLTKAKKTHRHEYKTIAEFKYNLEKFLPIHNHFTSVSIVVYYEHAFGKQHVSEQPVSSWDDKIYSSNDLQKIIQPMLMWLNKHPELLI